MFVKIRTLVRGSVLDFSRRQNTIFWVSQIAVILSTILGVYLAASEGLKSAVEFHAATGLEKKYFMLSSLKRELENNKLLLLEFSEQNLVLDEEGNPTAHRSMIAPKLNSFIWDTMSKSTETLELPFDVLFEVNNFYSQTNSALEQYADGRGRDKLFYGGRVLELSQNSDQILQRMQTQISAYRERLAPYQTLGVF